jgi:hypothetical protein
VGGAPRPSGTANYKASNGDTVSYEFFFASPTLKYTPGDPNWGLHLYWNTLSIDGAANDWTTGGTVDSPEGGYADLILVDMDTPSHWNYGLPAAFKTISVAKVDCP